MLNMGISVAMPSGYSESNPHYKGREGVY